MEFIEKRQLAKKYLIQDNYSSAVSLYEQCIEAAPEEVLNYWELGIALVLAGEEAEAQALWLQVILHGTPEKAETNTIELINLLSNEGKERLELGKYQQAEKIYWQILELNQDNSVAYNNLGIALLSQGKLEEAIACYQQAVNLDPNSYEATNNLGATLQKQGKLEEAIACYQQCLTLKPNDAITYNYLGRALQKQGKLEEAIACYQQSLLIDPNQPIVVNDVGTIFYAQDKIEEAIFYYQQAFKLDSKYAMAYYNLGVLLINKGHLEKALFYFNRTLEIEPDHRDAHWNRGLILLKVGDYQGGFAEYEWRWRKEQTLPRSFIQPVWDGSPLEGRTILLYYEQGFGDTIQFIRYAPIVQQRGGIVVVECQPPLMRLLKTVSGIDTLIAKGTTLPKFDVQAPLMSLPYILGTTLETVPNQVPYLLHDPSLSFRLEHSRASFKLGIVWAGSPQHEENHNRSCSLKDFLGILNTPEVTFYSLQKDIAVEELAQLPQKVQI